MVWFGFIFLRRILCHFAVKLQMCGTKPFNCWLFFSVRHCTDVERLMEARCAVFHMFLTWSKSVKCATWTKESRLNWGFIGIYWSGVSPRESSGMMNEVFHRQWSFRSLLAECVAVGGWRVSDLNERRCWSLNVWRILDASALSIRRFRLTGVSSVRL